MFFTILIGIAVTFALLGYAVKVIWQATTIEERQTVPAYVHKYIANSIPAHELQELECSKWQD